jgi:hypothetical protein
MSTCVSVPALRPLIQVVREAVSSNRPGKKLHNATAIRWHLQGVSDGKGGRICLWAQRGPGCWLTTAQAVREFLGAVAAARSKSTTAAPLRSATQRQRAIRQAGRALDAAGVK